jgi:hypothetical protein
MGVASGTVVSLHARADRRSASVDGPSSRPAESAAVFRRERDAMRKSTSKKAGSSPADTAAPAAVAADREVSTARAATQDELAAIARAQQGQLSAESFWKTAGRLTKLR